MRFVTFVPHADGLPGPAWALATAGAARVGVQDARGQIHAMRKGRQLIDLLGDDGETLHEAGTRALAQPDAVFRTADVRLLPPIPSPPTMRDFMAFEQHVVGTAKLMDPGATVAAEWYDLPAFYFTNPHNLIGATDPVPAAPGSARLDFELEVAAVIGRAGTDLTPVEAERHIIGYTVVNDWSARDLQAVEMRMMLGPCKGKDTATTIGPALVTADELAPFAGGTSFDLGMRAEINGVPFGQDRLSNMHWSFGEMVAYASRGTWVRPGDVLGSGTCSTGCLAELWGREGLAAHPPLALGDTVTLTVDVLGTLSNTIVSGSPLLPLRQPIASTT